MDIGTAKPDREDMGLVPHHMIDVVNPDEEYNAALYSRSVKTVFQGIRQRGRLPILVGGTGLYIKAVIDGYSFTEAGTDRHLRERLMGECAVLGRTALHGKLMEIDPQTAARLHENDVKRVVRALEVFYLTGKTLSAGAGKEEDPQFDLLIYGLTMDRKELYSRIEKRVDKMMTRGLVEEVRGLLAAGYSPGLASMQGLGYKEIIHYLKGETTLDRAVDMIKKHTRRFAKRQLTWFRRDGRIKWLDVGLLGVDGVSGEIAGSAEGVFKAVSKK